MKQCLSFIFVAGLVILATSCASQKPKLLSQRGWIGGEYALSQRNSFLTHFDNGPGLAGNLPQALAKTDSAAVKITHVATNTPAATAGLHEDDFIVEVNHRSVGSLESFRRTIDRSKPGALLAVKAWRDGKFVEFNVPVGCEKYKTGGYFSVIMPTVVHRWDLWPNPGFSLICIGYEPNPGLRHDIADKPKPDEIYDRNWEAYLIFMELSKGERVVSQEPAAISQGD